MATTFHATDLRTNRPVAIKIPHPDMESDAVFSDRFQREQQIGMVLNHPGVMKVITDNDRVHSYMVTEWFEGKSLRQILSGGRLAPDRARRIALQICGALEAIHGRGIVHRDLEPENILLDAQDHIKLVHFGAAAQDGPRRLTFTNLSQVVGTSVYISPEELRGKRSDARSDLYSLGVILYEMLTQTTPFPGVEPCDRASQRPVPPREIDPAISPQLQEVIYRALEPEPRNRYPNAHGFAWDLEHLDQVGVADQDESHTQKESAAPSLRAIWFVALALIPIAIFGLLFYFARR